MPNKKTNLIHKLKLGFKVSYLFFTSKKVTAEDVADAYNEVSQTYQSFYLDTMHTYNDQMLRHLVEHVPNGRVLDLAGGTGYNTTFLMKNNPLYKIDLVDIAQEMLDVCGTQGIHKICAGMCAYMKTQKDACYDAIVCSWALMYENPKLVLRECHRLLKVGGFVYILVNNKQTLPQVRRIYPKLLQLYISDIEKLMMDLPTPKNTKMLKHWGKKQHLMCHYEEDCYQDFTFSTWQEAATFVTSTGALAGYDKMIDLKRKDIFDSFIELLSTQGDKPCITHHFVKMIFQKEDEYE